LYQQLALQNLKKEYANKGLTYMIKLFQFHSAFGLPNPSPFCLKAETYLKMAKLDYEVISTINMNRTPKGKMPFIEDQGTVVADSGAIIKYLENKYSIGLDTQLSLSEKAVAFGLARMLEEHYYWTLVYNRWIDDSNWPLVKKVYFGGMPLLVRDIIPAIARKIISRDLKGHGMGRHRLDEIYALGVVDVNALAAFLEDKEFVMGGEVTTVDATAYAFIACTLHFPNKSPMIEAVKSHNNLVAYYKKLSAKYYPEMNLVV